MKNKFKIPFWDQFNKRLYERIIKEKEVREIVTLIDEDYERYLKHKNLND